MRNAATATLRALPRLAAPAGRAAASMPPVLKRRLRMLVAALVVLAAVYMLWFRDSSLVAVEKVQITGLTTSEAERVRSVLEGAARDMTTLHVKRDELEEAVRGFGVVHALEVQADFPHRLHIRVIERRAAAVVLVDGRRIPVAGDGTILTGLPVDGNRPVLELERAPGGKRVDDPVALRALKVISAAPVPLAERILRVKRSKASGVVAQIRRGPDVILGSLEQLRAKWAAAASVLADEAARGATYVDVRLPDRPAAGGLGEETVEPAGAEELRQAAAQAAAAAGQAAAPVPAQQAPPVPGAEPQPGAAQPDAQAAPPAPAQQAPQAAPPAAPGATEQGGAAPAP